MQQRQRATRSSSEPGPTCAQSARVRPERFLLVFFACLLVAFGLLLAPFMRPAVGRFSRALVETSGMLIGAAGGKALVEGTVLRAPSSGFAIEMKDGCNGVNVMILLWSAVLAFPASRAWKVKGLLAGSAAIQGVNFIRFISLFYLGQYNMNWFEFAHAYLWESLIMLDALVVFWLWAAMVFRSAAVSDAVR
jgi:exosortase H (IPTLxxWG-CTERM-specific)